MNDAKETANITINGRKIAELPVLSGSLGSKVLAISSLGEQGYYSHDPGFISTSACESKITYIDSKNGRLLHYGYPIEQLAEEVDYMEVCYLLLNGELPNIKEKEKFVNTIKNHTMVHEQLCNFFNGFRRDAHPMAIMVGVVGALSAFYHDSLDISNPDHRASSAIRLIAKMPTIAAMCYKYSLGQPFVYPQNRMSYAENFLHMMFGVPTELFQPNPVLVRAMDRIFTLHADHGQNASTTTVRVAGSTGANPFACISAGIGALWGPAHGGANEACLNMLKEIGTVARIDEYIRKAKNPNDPFRLMGFGHRVYKNYDPRAKVMRDTCYEVLAETDHRDDPIFKLALKLEKIALEDEYFINKKLYPNVDFYSGITLNALGIPTNMYTVIFALARTVGWMAHWIEMISSPSYRLSRPTQLYTGKAERGVIPLSERD